MKRRSKNSNEINSSVVIARLLASEGYTSRVHSGIKRYASRQLNESARRRYERICKTMSEVASKLSAGDRLVIGRFISWHSRLAVDAGLRIGLAGALTSPVDEIENQGTP